MDFDEDNKENVGSLWFYRSILRISWMDHVANVGLSRMKKNNELLTTVNTRKLQYLEILRNESRFHFIQIIKKGKVLGKRSIEKRRISFVKKTLQTGFLWILQAYLEQRPTK